MREVELGSVCKFINGDRGKNYPSQDAFVKKGIPFINAGSLHNKGIDTSKVNYITEEKYTLISSGKVEINDILFCLRGSLGKYSVNTELREGAIASSLVIFRVKPELDVRYLANYLGSNSIRKQIYVNDNGSSQPNLSATNVKKFKIPLPPLPIQKKIAAILDEADKIRQLNKKLIAKYDELTQSLFLEMFGDIRSNNMNWVLTPLGEVSTSRLGKMLDKKKIHGGDLRYYIQNRNVHWEKFKLENLEQMDFDEKEQKEFELIEGDVLVCEGGEVGRAAVWEGDKTNCYFQKALHRVRVDKDKLVPVFLVKWLRETARLTSFRGYVTSVTIPHLTGVKLKSMKIVVPPIDLQNQFAERVQAIETQKAQAQQGLVKAEDLFNSLLQRAFKGELVN